MSILLRVRLFSSRKHLRTPELNEHPATGVLSAIAAPRVGDPWAIRTVRSRKLLTPLWPPDSPATPASQASSGYERVSANRTSFRRVHLSSPDPIGSYSPAAGPAAQPFAAYDTSARRQQEHRWSETAAHLQLTRLGVYSKTDPAYYTGWYPSGFAAEKAHRIWFERKHLELSAPVTSPLTSTTAAAPPSYFAPKQHQRHEQRKVVRLPILLERPRTIQTPSAYAPITTIRRRDTARILRFPTQLDTHPATPKTAAVPPSYFAPPMHRRHGRSNIVLLPEFPDRKENIFPGTVREAVNHVWYWDRYA